MTPKAARARGGWYAAPDIEVGQRVLPRPLVLVGIGTTAVIAGVVIAVVEGPGWRALLAWALSLFGTTLVYLALTVRHSVTRTARGYDVRIDPQITGWVMIAVGLVLPLRPVIELTTETASPHWSTSGLLLVGAAQAGGGIAILVTPRWVRPREGASRSRP